MNFTGPDAYLAGHSTGGTMAGWFTGTPEVAKLGLKGLILAASDIIRAGRVMTHDGKTYIRNLPLPTVTLTGTKDGILRLTRVAESYWHQTVNIDSK